MLEADLRHFYDVRLSDLWRCDEHGHRLLTLREVWVYAHWISPTSALAIDDNGGTPPWSRLEHLVADHWELDANRDRGRGKPKVKHPRRMQQQSRQLAQTAARKRSKFDKAKARREREIREQRARTTQ